MCDVLVSVGNIVFFISLCLFVTNMGVLRSEFMSHGTLVLPHEWARDYVDLLGHKTQIMFEDMNSSVMQR